MALILLLCIMKQAELYGLAWRGRTSLTAAWRARRSHRSGHSGERQAYTVGTAVFRASTGVRVARLRPWSAS